MNGLEKREYIVRVLAQMKAKAAVAKPVKLITTMAGLIMLAPEGAKTFGARVCDLFEGLGQQYT